MGTLYFFHARLKLIAVGIFFCLPAFSLHAQDTDGDGIADASDNCPNTPNANQRDADGDGVGDACLIITGVNTDGDVWPSNIDNCPDVSNNDQPDADADGLGDGCDPDIVCAGTTCLNGGSAYIEYSPRGLSCACLCPSGFTGPDCANSTSPNPGGGGSPGVEIALTPSDLQSAYHHSLGLEPRPSIETYATDYDQDGVLNGSDNAPYISNASQTDSDSDGIGDASDNCFNTSNADQADSDNNGVGDACDAVFPVEILGFEARELEEVIYISWVTASEDNNDVFRLYKGISPSEMRLFKEINGSGTTQQVSSYQVRDYLAADSRLFYRLTQVDFDGRARFVGMVELTLEESTDQVNITVLSNPVKTGSAVQLQIENFTEHPDVDISVTLIDMKGNRVIDEKYASGNARRQRVSLQTPASLPAGAYVIDVKGDTWEQRKTIIIQ